jgi:hypothetical protein
LQREKVQNNKTQRNLQRRNQLDALHDRFLSSEEIQPGCSRRAASGQNCTWPEFLDKESAFDGI